MKYYTIDFLSQTGGTVQVLAKSAADAWKVLSTCDYVSEQVEDQVPGATKMTTTFYKNSVRLDKDQTPVHDLVPLNTSSCKHQWYFPIGMVDTACCHKCTAMRDLR